MLHTGCGRSKDFTKSPVRYGRVASQSGKFGSPAIAVENSSSHSATTYYI